MAKQDKYGLRSLRKEFPTERVCLDFLFDAFHGRLCSCGGRYSLLKRRRQFQCSRCRFQIAPTAGTVFEKSKTPLTLWFHAAMVFSNAKSGISASEMERQLEVTYKCAWRILYVIRSALTQSGIKLKGDVEADDAYIGGRARPGKPRIEAFAAKSVVMAAMKRHGDMRAKVVRNTGTIATSRFIETYVERTGTRLMTDKGWNFARLGKSYDRHSVNHSQKEYVREDVHVNNVESFWSHVKRSVAGTHKGVSKEHLQSYLDVFVFHYNNRHNDRARFGALLGMMLCAGPRR